MVISTSLFYDDIHYNAAIDDEDDENDDDTCEANVDTGSIWYYY